MLTLEQLKVVLLMMGRAQCSGNESKAVAVVMDKVEQEIKRLTEQPDADA